MKHAIIIYDDPEPDDTEEFVARMKELRAKFDALGIIPAKVLQTKPCYACFGHGFNTDSLGGKTTCEFCDGTGKAA